MKLFYWFREREKLEKEISWNLYYVDRKKGNWKGQSAQFAYQPLCAAKISTFILELGVEEESTKLSSLFSLVTVEQIDPEELPLAPEDTVIWQQSWD